MLPKTEETDGEDDGERRTCWVRPMQGDGDGDEAPSQGPRAWVMSRVRAMVQVMMVDFLKGSQGAWRESGFPEVVIAEPEGEDEAEEEDHAGELGLAEGAGDAAEAPADLGLPGEVFAGEEAGEDEGEGVLAHRYS